MRSRIPFVTALLVLANIAAYAVELRAGGESFCQIHGLIPDRFIRAEGVEPVFTSMFLHDPDSLTHIAGNMLFLAVFGAIVESALGHLRFLAVYLIAGVVGALAHVFVDPTAAIPLVGASGAIFGILAVAAVLRPRLLVFTTIFAALNVVHALFGGGGPVSFGAHIGGFFAGFVVALLLRVADDEALEHA